MAEPDPYPPEPSRLFIIGRGFDPKFRKLKIGTITYDWPEFYQTWRANRFVPTPGPVTWEPVDPSNFQWLFNQKSGGQSPRFGSFMVHGHYSFIDEITEENPIYEKRLLSATNVSPAIFHLVSNGDESGTTTYYLVGTYLGIYREVIPFNPSPNWDDGYDRGVMPASLEGAIVKVMVWGQEYSVGLEASAFVRSQGVIGQYVTSFGPDYQGSGNTYVKSITSRDGVPSRDTVWYDHP